MYYTLGVWCLSTDVDAENVGTNHNQRSKKYYSKRLFSFLLRVSNTNEQ